MEPKQLLDHLSSHVKNAIARAISLAASMGHGEVTVLHMLAGIREEQGSVASEILHKFGLEHEAIVHQLAELPTVPHGSASIALKAIPELNAPAKKALERAMLLAYEREHTYIGTEHLLYGILQASDEYIAEALHQSSIDLEGLIDQIEQLFESTSRFPEMEDLSSMLDQLQSMMGQQQLPGMEQQPQMTQQGTKGKKKATALELFATELTNKKRQKEIDPVIGRADEIERLVHILSRRNKNNPVLVGEPGVGKTAIVEGLAKKILEKDVPHVLKRKRVFSLDLTSLIAGTIYRGEFEARLKQLIDECSNRDDVILFVDEIHNIIGAGSNQGTMDAANILKPALARGKLRCIGATTKDEYKKYISGDPALDRRFQSITVEEPSEQEAVDILLGVKKYYEQFHNTTISDGAVESAVHLATKYIHDYFLPDKAIDLLDEAAASVRVKQQPSAVAKKIITLEERLEQIEEKKEAAIAAEAFDDAMKHKQAAEKLQAEMKALEEKPAAKSKRATVEPADIAAVLGRKLDIEPTRLLTSEWEQLDTLGQQLKKQVIGQDRAIDTVVNTLRQSYLGIDRKRKPLASFLFAGPSGVGKTKLAQTLAQELYFDERALVRIDMSEFAEAHGVSKLLGSPAGYIGYKERNKFLDTIQSRPYSVVLFDEFDKAHADVRKLLYQILDEGVLTDGSGKKISFRHAIVILTSNAGADIFRRGSFGFGSSTEGATSRQDQQLREALKEQFGPAFLGRIKAICPFAPLTKEDTVTIIEQHIAQLNVDLQSAQDLQVKADKKALTALAEESYDAELGVRNMEHIVDDVVQRLVIETLASKDERKRSYRLTKTKSAYQLR